MRQIPDTFTDVHPVPDRPAGKTLDERVAHLEHIVAALWDQVWWLSLPTARREMYEGQGHKAPIIDFYGPGSSERP